MSLLVEASVAHPDFVLNEALESSPGVVVEPLYRTQLTTSESSLVFEVTGDELGDFEAALEADSTVNHVQRIADDEDRRLYNVRHAEVQTVSPIVADIGGCVKSVHCHGDGRRLRLELPDRDALRALREECERDGVTFQVERLYRRDGNEVCDEFGLTELQHETLCRAHERGYFSDPRETSLQELAGEFDVSSTALGRRLRRGCDTLIENALRTE